MLLLSSKELNFINVVTEVSAIVNRNAKANEGKKYCGVGRMYT